MNGLEELLILKNRGISNQMEFSNTVLRKIVENTHDGITVTDKDGLVILANPPAAKFMNRTVEELVGTNVRSLLKQGFYDRSTILEAIKTTAPVTKLISFPSGKKAMSTSIPVLDDYNQVFMIVTTTINQDVVDSYTAAIEKEKNKSEQYKSAANYLENLGINGEELISMSPVMQSIRSEASLIARTDSTAFISGESGTGKEVMARFIHKNSNRRNEPFIPVNCAAIPGELMESEFFGYEKGAFSGASPSGKLGFFEMASKGTLFLDEVGELPLHMQSKLLRVLESGEFKRVGGTRFIKTDVRLIAATNRNMENQVRQKLFREDLFYRLNVLPIVLPPLRERPEDILALAERFLFSYNTKFGSDKVFSKNFLLSMINYSWPGNGRELRNLIERLVIITPGNELEYELLSNGNPVRTDCREDSGNTEEQMLPLKMAVRDFEARYINRILSQCNGKVSRAAEQLGIHRTQIYRKLSICKELD